MAETVIFAEQTLTGFADGQLTISPAPFVLTVGETYRVVWDGVEHECVCVDNGGPIITDADNMEEPTSLTFLINVAIDESEGFDEALMVAYDLSSGSIAADTATEHTVAIYLVAEDSGDSGGDTESGNDVCILGYGGDAYTYENVPMIYLTGADGTRKVAFSYGEVTEDMPITGLDFSGGAHRFEAPDGVLVKSAVVEAPEGLTPENIANGVEVAGIVGEFIGHTEDAEVALSMADGDQVITPSETGKVLGSVTVKKPETLVPENIVKDVEIGGVVGTHEGGETEEKEVELDFSEGNQVITPSNEEISMSKVTIVKPATLISENIAEGVEIAGIVGTLTGGSGDDESGFDPTDENLKYILYNLDPEAKEILVTGFLDQTKYAATGNYNLTLPDKIGGYQVVIASNGAR